MTKSRQVKKNTIVFSAVLLFQVLCIYKISCKVKMTAAVLRPKA